jgi:hypothetical protein
MSARSAWSAQRTTDGIGLIFAGISQLQNIMCWLLGGRVDLHPLIGVTED